MKMKKLALLGMLSLLVVSATAVLATTPTPALGKGLGSLILTDKYLITDLSKGWGPATVDSVLDLPGEGVRFDLSGLTSAGTGISDNFPISVNSGCAPHSVYTGTNSDCTAFRRLQLRFTNLGTSPVDVTVFINTGFTGGGAGVACGTTGPACDTYWESGWVTVPAGEKTVATLNFNSAIPWGCAGNDPANACSDGIPQSINLLGEVSRIGFQVVDWTGGPTATSLIVDGW